MSATVIPRSLNLGAVKPTTIPAYSRRVESIATNAQSFSENGIANIVLDTSTPGSFLDPSQSLLQFDIDIINSNPYIDYINLSTSGIAAVIQEMRIICQGTPIEEILDYNLMFEMFMDLGGQAQEEFKMYVENSWRAPVANGISDLNFVKPPMVDREGIIMCPGSVNIFGDMNLYSVHNEDGTQVMNTTEIVLKGPTQTANNQSFYATTNFSAPSSGVDSKGPNFITAGANGYYTGSGIAGFQRAPSSSITPGGLGATNAAAGLSSSTSNPGNYIHYYNPGTNTYMGCTAGGNVRSQTWTNRIDNTYVTWPNTIRPEPLIKNELRMRMEGDVKKYRIQDYLDFLTNVKNIPVGVAPLFSTIANEDALKRAYTTSGGTLTQSSGETLNSNWNFANIAQSLKSTSPHSLFTSSTTRFSVSLPIFSGILGVWAEKQFPSMLISPGSFYFQIKFAKAAQAFQCAMDPCRRLIGSYRDYIPNAGLYNFYATEYRGQVLRFDQTDLFKADNATTYCNGTNSTWMALTIAGTTGNDFAWKGMLGLYTPADTNTPATALSSDLLHGAYRNNLFANATDGTLLKVGSTSSATTMNDFAGQGQGNTTGHAKPQYVPRAIPWQLAANGFSDTAVTQSLTGTAAYVRERHVCFGTYLPFSTAQVRRTRLSTNNQMGLHAAQASVTGNTTNCDLVPTYNIYNLRYVGMQTILPDEVTASIVRTAASSDISLHAQSCRSYRTLLSQSNNQNIILPVKVASANSMWVVFQNQNMIENTYYNSLTRICPFTSFQWTADPGSKFVGSDTAPVFTPMAALNPFQIQLRIGNELLPMQPITSIPQVITELQRSIHALPDMDTKLNFISSFRHNRFGDNVCSSANQVNKVEYSSLKSNDFCVPFIPVQALDDQTITNNQSFLDYHYATGSTTVTSWPTFNDRGTYSFNEFLPPISKFLLGFDLDTFPGTNDSARSGRYLGNAPLTLSMTNTYAASLASGYNGSTTGSADTIIATAFVLHDIRFSIMAGGQVLAYY